MNFFAYSVVMTAAGFIWSASLVVAGSRAPENGCAMLFDLSKKLCVAKVDCTPYAAQLPKAKALYASCVDQKTVTTDDVTLLLNGYETPLNYQCCVGNALDFQNRN